MASGRAIVLGSRESCSICLEAFRGRNPKILPCFHTFCLACLSQLAEKATRQKVSDAEDVLITCPTCRTDVQVPAEGVGKFQSNFYLDQGNQGPVQPIICDLCDQDQVASHFCTNCQMKLCFHCHRGHSDCPRAAASTQASIGSAVLGNDDMAQLSKMAKDQMETISMARGHAVEEEKKLLKQKESMEDHLHDLYKAGLARLVEARDDILRKIRSHTQANEEQFQSEMANMQRKHDTLADLTAQSDSSPVTVADLRAALMSDSELKALHARAQGREVQFFRLRAGDHGPMSVVNSLQRLIFGTLELIPATQDDVAQVKDGGDHDSFESFGDVTAQSPSQAQRLIQTQQGKAEDVTVLSRLDDLAQKSQFTLNKVKENESREKRLQIEMRNLMEEVKAMRDKNSLIIQDLAVIQAENAKLRGEMSQLQTSQQMHSQGKNRAAGISGVPDCPEDINSQDLVSSAKFSTSMKDFSAEFQTQIQQLLQDVKSLKNSHAADSTSIQELRSKIERAVDPVYFKAELDRTVTTKSVRTLICKDVLANVGDGYDEQTGKFCAPVSGTYLFIATAAPHNDRMAQFDICHDDFILGSLYSDTCNSSSSVHCIVEMDVGDRVWLKTMPEPSSFDKDSMTTFSGVLLMRKLSDDYVPLCLSF